MNLTYESPSFPEMAQPHDFRFKRGTTYRIRLSRTDISPQNKDMPIRPTLEVAEPGNEQILHFKFEDYVLPEIWNPANLIETHEEAKQWFADHMRFMIWFSDDGRRICAQASIVPIYESRATIRLA